MPVIYVIYFTFSLFGNILLKCIYKEIEMLANRFARLGFPLILSLSSATAFASEPSALEKHIKYFSDQTALVSKESIYNALVDLHFKAEYASIVADKVSYFSGLLIKGCPYATFTAKEGVGPLNHARDTGIYNLDGSINEDRWQKLKTYSETDDGIEIITEAKFYEFLKWCRDNDTRPDESGLAQKFSDGEWKDFFTHASDHWKKSDNDYERSITLQTLRTFYDDSTIIFDRVKKEILPAPKPSANITGCPSVASIKQEGLDFAAPFLYENGHNFVVGKMDKSKYDTDQYWIFGMIGVDAPDRDSALKKGTELLNTLTLVDKIDKDGSGMHVICWYRSNAERVLVFAGNDINDPAKFSQLKLEIPAALKQRTVQ
jgi:hypothetical protein